MDDAPRPSAVWRDPRSEREALEALRSAARRLGVEAQEIRVTEYRFVRSRDPRLPSEFSIRQAFGSWQRARERAIRRVTPAGSPRQRAPQ